MIRSLVALAATLTLLAGCATQPAGPETFGQDGAIAAGRGRIYFYRTTLSLGGPNSLLGDNTAPQVRLDGRPLAEALAGGVFFCDVAPGAYEVSVRDDSISVHVAAGAASYVRMDWGFSVLSRRGPLLEVDAATGRAETEGRTRIAARCPA